MNVIRYCIKETTIKYIYLQTFQFCVVSESIIVYPHQRVIIQDAATKLKINFSHYYLEQTFFKIRLIVNDKLIILIN